jgi:hypothetical protein
MLTVTIACADETGTQQIHAGVETQQFDLLMLNTWAAI